MTANYEKNNNGLFVGSKFFEVLLVIVAVLLLFVGPTYIPYVLSNLLRLGSIVAVTAGFALFMAGLLLMLFLIRKKIIF